MAIVAMADAVSGATASSAEYNKLIDNIQDLDARLGAVTSASTAHSRLTTLESRTTNASTGNVQLGTRIGQYESAPTAYLYQTAAQAVASGTNLTMDATLVDTDGHWAASPNPSRLTIQRAGIYIVSGGVGLAGGGLAASRRIASIRKNGSDIPGAACILPPTANTGWNLFLGVNAFPIQLAAGDYLELRAYWGAEDTSGVTKTTVVTAGYNSYLSAIWQRP